MSFSVTVQLSDALKAELQQPGVFAYGVYFTEKGTVANWLPDALADGSGNVNSSQTFTIDTPYDSGKIYFVIQSVASGSAPTIGPNASSSAQLINAEGDVIANAVTGDWRWDSVELSVNGNNFDVANLTSVNGFGIPMSISNGLGGDANQRGYNVSGDSVYQAIKDISDDAATTQNIVYTAGPLAAAPTLSDPFANQRGMLSPTEALGASPPIDAFKATDWKAYIDALKGDVAKSIVVSGWFNGAPGAVSDTPGMGQVWHNQGYYAYHLSWDQANQTFWLEPEKNSQVKGYLKISDKDLRDSIYSTQGEADVYVNKTDGTAWLSDMNTGANNQWGAVLRDLFVGFTAGYYGATGKSPNSFITTGIDLNSESNWDPTYAFANNPFAPNSLTGATYDKYAQEFFNNTNSYGAGYSDYLMKSLANGPLMTLWNPAGSGQSTSLTINLFANADTPATATFNGAAFDTAMGYAGTPTMNNYIAPPTTGPHANQYVDLWDAGTGGAAAFGGDNISFVLGNASVVANDIATGKAVQVSLGLWNGSQMVYIALPTQTDTIYKTYTLQFTPGAPGQDGTYSFSPATNSNVTGTLNITGLPVAADGTASWYALKVTSADGSLSKIVNVYATADTTTYHYNNPSYPGQATAVQADGLAVVAGGPATQQTWTGLSVALLSSSGFGLSPQMLTQLTDQTQIQDPGNGIFLAPYAPVLGTGTGSTFKAVQQQGFDYATTPTPNGYNNPSNVSGSLVTFVVPSEAVIGSKLSFGWWGADKSWVQNSVTDNAPVLNHADANTDASNAGSRWNPANMKDDGNVLIDYTNKVGALNKVVIEFVTSDASGTYASHASTTGKAADLDGQWTTNSHTFVVGQTYKAMMYEYAPTDTSFQFPLNKVSDGIAFTVNSGGGGGDSSLAGGSSIQFNPGTTGSDGVWVRLDTSGSTLHNGTLLAYFTDSTGQMLSRADDSVTTSLDLAVRTYIGLVKTDDGGLMFGGVQSVYLPTGMQMKFAIQTGDGVIKQLPDINASGSGTLSVKVSDTVGTLNLSAMIDSSPGDSANLALTQQDFDRAWVYLTRGETVKVDVAGSAYNNNALHLVHIDVDLTDAGNVASWSVGGVAWGNTDAFRAAVQANWEGGYSASGGRGNFQDSKTMTVSTTGYYAPVLTTEGGDLFVIGSTANSDGHSHVRVFGQNLFGFEDLKTNSDWDYNDLVMKIART